MLRQDARDVEKMASRGHLPARRVGGEWTFAAAEINLWLEKRLPGYSDEELSRFDSSAEPEGGPVVCQLLAQDSIELGLQARTRSSLLQEMVKIAERSWQVWNPQALLASLREREQRSSTAQAGGVAIPHPARRLPDALGESVVSLARLAEPLSLGAPDNAPTDLVFMVACRSDGSHWRRPAAA
jgi:PTS system nitrogen regulatory IIA component